jgi:glycerol-3-phosphate acyltransferase PlsY
MSTYVITAVVAYLLGSIPFGLVLVKLFRGTDIRATGSGNIGATNVARVAPKLGALTLGLDVAKGLLAVMFARYLTGHPPDASGMPSYVVALTLGVASLAAVIGHVFPIWLNFKGGKGVATALGVFLGLMPTAVLITAAFFLAVYLLSHYVSLASITSAAIFPVVAFVVMQHGNRRLLLPFIVGVSLLIIVKHHQNIRRLLAGTEHRLDLRTK